MNPSPPSDALNLPSDYERRQLFHWLKKLSSVAAWRRILAYYQAWADEAQLSLREADDQGWGDKTAIPHSHYAIILRGLAHCEEGVKRLGNGDKRVFKFDANGEFAMARRALFFWAEMTSRIEMGENGIDKPHTPRWAEFDETLTSACQAWQECGQQILELRSYDDRAPTFYGQWLQDLLKNMPFPQKLPALPLALEETFVRTGSTTPFSGIWEPVEAPASSFMHLLTGAPKPQAPFKIAGAMNYLHGGSNAPQIAVLIAGESSARDTTWRLLWEDERYLDGTIPSEEVDYRFTKPDPTPEHRPATTVSGQYIWAESGTPARAAGRWRVESDLAASVVLQKGETLPLHHASEVRWILDE